MKGSANQKFCQGRPSLKILKGIEPDYQINKTLNFIQSISFVTSKFDQSQI